MSPTSRRTALRLIGSAPLALGFGLGPASAARAGEQAAKAVAAGRKGPAYKPKFFTAHEWETVRVLVDLIIPRDERSGSATDAGVPEFMDFFLTDSHEDDRSRERRQTTMRGGLAWIDVECRRRFGGKDFVECAETERTALLDEIAYWKGDEEDDRMMRERRPRVVEVILRHGPNFFNSFRDLTASGFWSSKMGVEDLGYKGNTFVREFTDPPAEVLRKLGLVVTLAAFLCPVAARAADIGRWPQHDRTRPAPKIVDPGPAPAQPAKPPADAVVLFDGKDLSAWKSKKDGSPAKWKVENGYMEVVKGTGYVETVQGFGDCQLHVEWMAPSPPVGQDQDRGNSGVFLMGIYEIQVLDSSGNVTYPDGQAAAVYGQYPPLVNASRPPGEWQTYDIVFHGPRFDADGKVTRKARVTVLHNGVLVQDDVELVGPTANKARPPYTAHPAKLPLGLQDHDHPVRFRNIWIRELAD
jgi:Domain of Unknown Function (DUF1080)/Gluconate 2-dehydrogenase subunit 3